MLTLVGVVLVIIAIVCACMLVFSSKPKLEKLLASSRVSIGDTLKAYHETKASLGDMGKEGVVSEDMTIMGKPRCESPLTSPLGQKECLYYSYRVTEKHKERETYYETDSNGNRRERTRMVTKTSTLDEGSNSTRFFVDDGTGEMLVDPQGGTFEGLVKTVDRTDSQFSNASGPSVSFGGLSFNLGSGSSRPESLHYEEEIIGLDRRVTVVGTLCDKMGDLLIEQYKDSHVLVSTKSQDEMIAETKSSIQTQKICAIACGIIGIVLMIIGLAADI